MASRGGARATSGACGPPSAVVTASCQPGWAPEPAPLRPLTAVIVNWKSELTQWLPTVRCVYYVGNKASALSGDGTQGGGSCYPATVGCRQEAARGGRSAWRLFHMTRSRGPCEGVLTGGMRGTCPAPTRRCGVPLPPRRTSARASMRRRCSRCSSTCWSPHTSSSCATAPGSARRAAPFGCFPAAPGLQARCRALTRAAAHPRPSGPLSRPDPHPLCPLPPGNFSIGAGHSHPHPRPHPNSPPALQIDWQYIIIDEAQRMKDRQSKLARDLDKFTGGWAPPRADPSRPHAASVVGCSSACGARAWRSEFSQADRAGKMRKGCQAWVGCRGPRAPRVSGRLR